MRTTRALKFAGPALITAGAVVTAILAIAGPAQAATGWTVTPSPNPVGNDVLNGVTVRAQNDAWAVGYRASGQRHFGTVMLTEHWDGTAWRDVPNPGFMFHDQSLLGVAASAANDAWAVGFTRVTSNRATAQLTAHWDGAAWTVVPTPAAGTRDKLFSVLDFSPTNVYAAGTGDNHAVIEHWNGSAWSPVTLPSFGPAGASTSLTSLSASSPADIWALGTETHVVGVNVVSNAVSLHFNGVSWKVVPTATVSGVNRLTALTEVAPGNVWAVGETIRTDGTGAGDKVLIEHFDGTAWRTVTAPAVTGSPTMTGMVARSASDVWAVGYAAAGSFPVDHTVTLHFDGVCWSTVDSPNVGTGDNLLRGVAAGPVDLWAVGQSLTPAYTTLILHHS